MVGRKKGHLLRRKQSAPAQLVGNQIVELTLCNPQNDKGNYHLGIALQKTEIPCDKNKPGILKEIV